MPSSKNVAVANFKQQQPQQANSSAVTGENNLITSSNFSKIEIHINWQL